MILAASLRQVQAVGPLAVISALTGSLGQAQDLQTVPSASPGSGSPFPGVYCWQDSDRALCIMHQAGAAAAAAVWFAATIKPSARQPDWQGDQRVG